MRNDMKVTPMTLNWTTNYVVVIHVRPNGTFFQTAVQKIHCSTGAGENE